MPQAGLARARETDGTTSGHSAAFQQAWAFGQHPSVQAALLLEWMNRLEVVRLAAEYALHGGPTIGPGSTAAARALPIAYREAVGELRRGAALAPTLPTLLQAFVFRWGGFLVPGAGEEEAIGAEFGLTATETSESFALLDRLLPPTNAASWLRPVMGLNWLTLVPFPIQGLGVIYRDVVRPGWDKTLNSTAVTRLRQRETSTCGYL